MTVLYLAGGIAALAVLILIYKVLKEHHPRRAVRVRPDGIDITLINIFLQPKPIFLPWSEIQRIEYDTGERGETDFLSIWDRHGKFYFLDKFPNAALAYSDAIKQMKNLPDGDNALKQQSPQ
jgi:hypothetical protein